MNPITQAQIAFLQARWNRIVGKRWRRVPSRDTACGLAFLHPTKGFRFVDPARLGL